MTKENGQNSPDHQNPQQEKTFQKLLRDLCDPSERGIQFRKNIIDFPKSIEGYDLSPFQKTTLIKAGHAAGQYAYEPGYGFCCCCAPDDMPQNTELMTSSVATLEENLGPLAPLAGTWEGDDGYDTVPSEDRGEIETRYREKIKFEPIGPVKNHEQVLYGLKYSTMAWPIDEANPFHEEVGYWLWDSKEKQVLRCFIVPRGITVLAGGTVEPDAKKFKLSAKVGSQTYGICSNLLLDKEFRTVEYELVVEINDNRSFSYREIKYLKVKGQTKTFEHLDKNTLNRS